MVWPEQLAAFQEDSPFTPYDPDTGTGLQRPPPTAAELAQSVVAPGRAAEHPVGVLYHADHEIFADGICRQARLHARALVAAGVPIALRSIRGIVVVDGEPRHAADDDLAPEVLHEVGALRHAALGKTALVVKQTVIGHAQQLWNLLVPSDLHTIPGAVDSVLARTVVYTPWERDRVDRDVIRLLNRCGQVWLQCRQNIDAFVASGLDRERARYVPNAYDVELAKALVWPRVPTGKRFYSIGKWEPRKGLHELIGAFLCAYGPKDRALLTIKTNEYREWSTYPSVKDSLRAWMNDPRVAANGWTPKNVLERLRVITGTLPEKALVDMHRQSNVYVSASHGEGWNYPAFDAVAHGNTLVHVPWGGTEEFCQPGSTVAVPCGMGPVDPDYGWEADAVWASYDHEALVKALREAKPPSSERVHPADLEGRFGLVASGTAMRQNLTELAEKVAPELLEHLR